MVDFDFSESKQTFPLRMCSSRFSEQFGFVNNGGVSDYKTLSNKPSINTRVLIGESTLSDIGIEEITNIEIDNLFNSIFKGGH